MSRRNCAKIREISSFFGGLRPEFFGAILGVKRKEGGAVASLFQSTKNTRWLPTKQGRFLRSDLPEGLTEGEIARLLEEGVRTLVDLRTDAERRQRPCPLALRPEFCYHAMPVTGGNAVPSSPEQVPVSYRNMADAQMDRILDLILGAGTGVLFFCTAGKDRTGVVSALLLRRLGADRETILRDYLQSAENLRDSLEQYAARTGIDPAIITPRRDYMERFLELTK